MVLSPKVVDKRNNNTYPDYALGLDIGMASVGAALLASDHDASQGKPEWTRHIEVSCSS